MLNSIKAKQYFLILLPVLFLLLSNVSKCEYQVYYCGLREALLSAVLRSKGDPITVQYLVTVSTHLAVLLWYCSSHGSSLQSCPVLKSVSNFVVHHFRIAIISHWWAQIRQHCILQRNCIGSTLNFVWDEAHSFILSLISLSGTYRSPPEPVLSHQDCLRILRLGFHILIFFLFHILFWENIAGILWKAERVLSADSVLSPVLLRGHLVTPLLLALQRSQFSFWDLDLPAACPEAPSACRAAEETPALIQSAEPNTVSLNPRYLTIVSEVITTTLSLTSVIAELLFCVTFCSVSFLRYLNWKLPCPPG